MIYICKLHWNFKVHVGSLELRANVNIKQIVEVVSDYDKYPRLLEVHFLLIYIRNLSILFKIIFFLFTYGILPFFYKCKLNWNQHLKQHNDGGRVIVFVETKKGCDQLTR
jgi:superfamily II DNA/RNA helicase